VKTCPLHGEIPNSEIVKGYEYTKGEYVLVDEDEIDALRGESDHAVEIDTFVPPTSIDPKYFGGKTYYLMPDGPLAKKPYAVLLDVLAKKQLWGVARANISNREQLVILRVADGALCMDTMHYVSQLRTPGDLWEDLDLPTVGKEEAKLAAMLIDASTSKSVDLSKYHDDYNDQVRALLEAKVEGREIVTPPQAEHPAPTINLMDALKKSITRKQAAGSGKVAAAKQVAAASLRRDKGRPAAARRRKSAG
jgi:DNA end-binding protein Ku